MASELTNEDALCKRWAQIRCDYEHSDRLVDDICAEHGISAGTLRDRMRRWGWTRRRAPIPREGPPPVPAPQTGLATATALDESSSHPAASPSLGGDLHFPAEGDADGAPIPRAGDGRAIVPRLQSAVARVLPAIETTVAKLASGATHPRELERTARALAALTRTLRELNGLLGQHQAPAAENDEGPEDIDEFRLELARRMDAIVAARTGRSDDGAGTPTHD